MSERYSLRLDLLLALTLAPWPSVEAKDTRVTNATSMSFICPPFDKRQIVKFVKNFSLNLHLNLSNRFYVSFKRDTRL